MHTLFLQTTVGSEMLHKLQPGRWAEHFLLPVECGSRQLVLDKLVQPLQTAKGLMAECISKVTYGGAEDKCSLLTFPCLINDSEKIFLA